MPSFKALSQETRPWVGHADIAARLEGLLKISCAKGGSLVFSLVTGARGVGKSRLLSELCALVQRDYAHARCYRTQAEEADTVPLLGRLLAKRFELCSDDSLEDAQEKIIASVSEVLPPAQVTETSHLIGHLMGKNFEESAILLPLRAVPRALEARSFLALKRFLAADSLLGPVVFLIDDLENATPESMRLLHYLRAGLKASPIAWFVSADSTIHETHPDLDSVDEDIHEIHLGPLEPDACVELLAAVVPALGSPWPLSICRASNHLDGNPRAIVELVAYLMERKVLLPSGKGAFRLDANLVGDIPMPRSHAELISLRLDAMPADERRVLDWASVVGETFWLDAIMALERVHSLGDDLCEDPDGPSLDKICEMHSSRDESVNKTIERLKDKGWIASKVFSSIAGEQEYFFATPMNWSTVYDALPESRRNEAHAQCAQWLDLRFDKDNAAGLERIGWHLELGDEVLGAARNYRRAGQRAHLQSDHTKAIRLFSHALSVLGSQDLRTRILLWYDLGGVYQFIGDCDAALASFERMMRLSWLGASQSQAALAFHCLGRVWRQKGIFSLALDFCERSRDLYSRAGNTRGLASCLGDLGHTHLLMGQSSEALECISEGLSLCGALEDKYVEGNLLLALGNIEKHQGNFEQARITLARSLTHLTERDQRLSALEAEVSLADIDCLNGSTAAGERGWFKALKESDELGAKSVQARCLIKLGANALFKKRYEEGRSRLQESLEIALETGELPIEAEARRHLSRLDLAEGKVQAAQKNAECAHSLAEEMGMKPLEGETLITLAEVSGACLYSSDAWTPDRKVDTAAVETDSVKFFERGIHVFRTIGASSKLATGLEHFGRFRIEHGETKAGQDLLSEACALYTSLGMIQATEVRTILSRI